MNALTQIAPNSAFVAKESLPVPTVRMLRLSVTDRCNFRCRYCLPAGGAELFHAAEMLSAQQLVDLTAWLTAHTAIERVRITGGEPLIHPEIEEIVAGLAALPAIREVSLTTNGALLARKAWRLRRAGLKRVNISLDSLDPRRFADITRGAKLEETLAGVAAACEAGLTPIKLNAVLQRSTWKRDVPALLDYCARTGCEVRFIELMRTGTERRWCAQEYVPVYEVLESLMHSVVSFEDAQQGSARRTAMNWRGVPLTVGWITPRSHPFCQHCDRLRMDARGSIRRCLMDPKQFPLARAVDNMSAASAFQHFCGFMAGKVAPRVMDCAVSMRQIGG